MKRFDPNDKPDFYAAPRPPKRSFLQSIPGHIKLIVVAVLLMLLVFSFPIICQHTGKTLGNTVGVAVGSYKAVTDDIQRVYTEGKEDGLSAEDTTAVISEKTKEIGKMDVLVADLSITNSHKVGDKYQALYVTPAKVVFSIDMTEALVTINSNQKALNVMLPAVAADIYIDDTATEQVAEWSKWVYVGSPKEGFTAYMNSRNKIEEKAVASIDHYDRFENRAKEAAKKQVKNLVQSIVEPGYTIFVSFQ